MKRTNMIKLENKSHEKDTEDFWNDNTILNIAYQEVKNNLRNLKVDIKNDVLKELRDL